MFNIINIVCKYNYLTQGYKNFDTELNGEIVIIAGDEWKILYKAYANNIKVSMLNLESNITYR